MVKSANIPAIEAATDVVWSLWRAHLDAEGGAALAHNELVHAARRFKPISGWWAQEIAVAYEQQIGRRLPGQMNDGSFSVSVSRTLEGELETLHSAWCRFASALSAVDEVGFSATPTISATPKRLYWRVKFEDSSSVSSGMEVKSSAKVLLALEHKKLSNHADIAARKIAWAALFQECFG